MSHSTQTFISLKIDVTKIVKEHMYHSTKVNAKTGKKPVYLDCVVFANKDGEDDYGNTHYIIQSVSKEARAKGERGPIIGNATIPGVAAPAPKQAVKPAAKPKEEKSFDDDDDVDDEGGRVPF